MHHARTRASSNQPRRTAQLVYQQGCTKDDFPRRNFGKGFPRGSLKEVHRLEGGPEEDRGEKSGAPRGHKFAVRFEILSLAHARITDPYTRSPTRAQGGYINSPRRIRIGPFQTSGGWRTRMGGGGGVVWCGVVWCGVSPVSEVGRAGRRVGGTFLDQ